MDAVALPASPAQERLWFFSHLVPDVAVYNVPCRVEIGEPGRPVDVEAVRAALAVVVARHESLRTCLAVRDGQLTQLVHSEVPIVVEHTDLRELPAARATEIAARDAAIPIPLDHAPLWRARLIQCADGHCQLVFVVHHAVFDGLSAENFSGELLRAYHALSAGEPPDLPEPPLQYGEFAAWQQEQVRTGALDDQMAYWRRALADLPPPLRLPPMGAGRDHAGGPHRGGHVMFTVSPPLAQQVRDFARSHRTTPYVVLLAGFAVLLHRLTDEPDLLIGTPVSGRNRPELAASIGMFVNTLVLRADCAGDPGLGELVDRLRGTVMDALDNQDVAYDQVVKMLAPDRDATGSPLHRVVFNLLPGVSVDDLGNGTAKVDLLVGLAEQPDAYAGRLEYRGDLFDKPAATALTERLLRLLTAGLADPSTPIDRLPLLDEAERRDVLAAAAPAPTAEPHHPPADHESGSVVAAQAVGVIDLFAARVAATPELTAVVDATGDQLTYRELDELSNRLARHLASVAVVGPDVRVALLLDGGVDLAVAVLAVLKAGAAYVPLDPGHPPQRLRYLLADADVVAVITASTDSVGHDAVWIDLRADAERIAAHAFDPSGVRPHPDSLAYVTYTSGSTGQPKGVGVTHGNLAAYVDEIVPLLDTRPGRSFSQLQPLTFDFGATMFYGALLTSGTLHLVAGSELATDPLGLAEHLRRERIDYLKITPSHLRALLGGRPDPTALLPRRMLVLGGEASDWQWVCALRRSGCAVLNHYGPTETTVGAVVLAADAQPADAGVTTPLGRPLAHVRAYVLDGNGQPVPDGVAGELFIAGATVSRGYLGRPALTADRFRPDPYSGRPGARLYRTGDRVRRLPGGDLEFLGRLDDQVKIRGYRVELDEVRNVLLAAPEVADCAVAARPHAGGELRLVAYVVPAPGSGVDRLREYTAARLPAYMIPADFVTVTELPRTAHGKIDRAKLPDPDSAGAGPGAEEPVGTDEELVAGVFERLLNRDRVGRRDNFFALGGHSLLAIQLVSRLRAAFGVAMPVRAVFEEPTVTGIAVRVAEQRRRNVTPLPPITPTPRDGQLLASYGQRRLWFLDQLDVTAPVYNTHLFLRIDGDLDQDLLRRALTAIVDRHELLRTRFADHDGELWQIVHEVPDLPFTAVDLTGPNSSDAEHLLREHGERRFDLVVEPPLRVLLLREAPDRHQLLITIHHVANDAWSARLFTKELAEWYAALRAGRPAAISAPPVQYADFAAWQRRIVTNELRDTQLRYWRDRLAGLPERLALPTDRPHPARRGSAGAHVGFHVPAATVERLRALGVDENASLFMVLLAGFLTVLGRYTGQTDLAVGTPVSTRSRPEVEDLLGFFLNTLVLRTDCAGDPSFRELVRRTRAVTLDALTNQDVPFEVLVEELRPRRDLGGTPLAQVLFSVEETDRTSVRSDGIELVWRPFGTPTAKFDLSLYLWRQPDGLSGGVEYRTDLFDAASMHRLAGHYTAALAAAATDPETPVSRLDLVSAEDLALIERWNDTATTPEPFAPVLEPSVPVPARVAAAARAHPRATGPESFVPVPTAVAPTQRATTPEPFVSVPARVAAVARAHPEATALVWRGESISYQEFAARVGRLAAVLRQRGTGPGDVVAVLLERGPELVVAVHAIQAAGAAYLPLDPEHPAHRLAFQCRDAGVRLVVTTAALTDRVAGTATVLLGQDFPQQSEVDPVEVGPESPAYVIYTSGSTGTPKGVVVPHGAIENRLCWMQRTFPLRPGEDRVLHKTPAGFDVSVWELFWPLMTGATLVIAEPGGHRDPGYLVGLLAAERVSTVHFVPSMLDAFLAEPELAERLPALRRIVCSGEALPPALADRCQKALPQAGLHNLYGPTEAAVDVTWHPCRPGEQRVPIGAPIMNTQLRVLDQHGSMAAIGVPGELCIAGRQLAHGYLNRPALTAERFVPDPYGPPGSRLYRTGDVARWLPDGELEYGGRLDDQLKIRGMRVEPGEIEAALCAHPAVRAAAVVAPDGALVGYVVPVDPLDPPTAGGLRGHLAGLLPAHLVPATFRAIGELPVTTSGKLDRTALAAAPVLDLGADDDEEFELPALAAERAVADVWESVLGLDRVSAGDDFFDVGGDSIRALKVVARLRDAGYRLELAQVFEHQTVRELAAALTEGGPVADQVPTSPFALLGKEIVDHVRSRWPAAEDAYPLTALQAGMLFSNEYDESGATYHDVFTLRLAGAEYRPEALVATLARAVARHPILRTSLHVAEFDEPLQVVHATAAVPMTTVDCRAARPAELADALAAFEDAEKRRRFDLAAAPLLRVFLHRLPGDEQALTLSFHHAILDGWSVASLTTALLRGYVDRPEPAGTGSAQVPAYRDFVAEELARRSSPESEEFWRGVVTDAPGSRLPRLATSEAGPGDVGPVGVMRTELAADLAAGLRRAARRTRVPLRTVLLAAHLRATALLTGEPDVVTGVVTSSRPRHEAGAEVLGMFLNTIPIRVRVDLPSWSELIRRVYDVEVAAIPHRAYPLLDIQRLVGGVPVFDTLFDYRDFHVYRELPTSDRVRVVGYRFFEQTDLPFAANLIRGGDTLTLQLRYDSAQFAPAQVERIHDLYLRVLAALAEDVSADPRPSARYLGPDAEHIDGWNRTGTDLPDRTIPEMVAAQAARTPDLDAVVAGATRLSYAQLAGRVNQLAHHLVAQGVRPDDVVGVCLPRGAGFVVAVHAIMAAGAAYLPLDPDYPASRLALMAADASVTTVVTETALAGRLPGVAPVRLDGDADRIAAWPDTAVGVTVQLDSLAYVIYTSGSTGRPKGVAVSHRAIANRLAWMQDSYPIGAADRVLHKTPASFDVSVWELCWPLVTGAGVVVADPGGHRVPEYLTRLIVGQRITVVHFVPSMLDALLAERDLPARFAVLRLVFCSGEALPSTLAARALATLPGVELHNLYGPTEAAVDVTQHACALGEATVPIGRPVGNTRIEVLDATGERVPVGSPGELCIGGIQLARGYVGRPGLTAERFVPDAGGGRLYRTGDLARWLPSGELEYLGRLDHQVKVRGFRVEPGEIEAALTADPAVRSAAVLAPQGHDGGRRLVAYVVPEGGVRVDERALADRLRQHLPEHLVPAAYVQLDELPVTGNGKLDRAALPAPEALDQTTYVPPATAAELTVASVWSDVLGIALVGANDDFFTLGGDSIRSLKVVARLRAVGVPAAISDLYRHPTVRGLAGAVGAVDGPAAPDSPLPTAYDLVDAADLAILTRKHGGSQQ